MYLKRIELVGFKSFKEKTKFAFSPGVTAIVGPNGSGKSNIVDGIRWVLGEQNAKSLRGAKMEDVIFSGAQNRKPLGLASVSLVMDNSSKSLNMPYDEVIVTRKLYRSGESEYLINGATCRLKDITELFMDTGIGKDGYSIIGQGDVEQLLSSNQRRIVFEEATGINKHKTRRDITTAKLAKEEENLQRLQDIINEVESNLPRLEGESKKAKEFLRLNETLKLVKINLFQTEDEKLTKVLEQADENLEIIENQIQEDQEKQRASQDALREIKQKISELISQEDEKKADLMQNRILISKKESTLNLLNEQARGCRQAIERVQDQAAQGLDKIKYYKKLIEEYETEKAELTVQLKYKEKELPEIEQKVETIGKELLVIETLLTNQNNINYKLQLLKGYNTYNKSVQSIFKQKELGKLRGIVDTLGRLITVPAHLQTAIEITLGGAASNIVTEDEQAAKEAIEYLKRTGIGRATFLPISSIKYREDRNRLPNHPGVLGRAADIITYDKSLTNIISTIMGDVIIVDNINNALEVAKITKYRITTQEGEAISKSGAISGGSVKPNEKQREMSKMQRDLEEISQKLCNVNIDKIKAQKEELASRHVNIKITIGEIKQKQGFNMKQLERIQKESESYNNLMSNFEGEVEKIKAELQTKESQIAASKNDIHSINEQISTVNINLAGLLTKKQELTTNLSQLEKETENQNLQVYDMQSEKQRLAHKIEITRERKSAIYNTLWEEYELTYQKAKEFERLNISFDSLKKKERELKESIKNLGPISLQSIDEHREVNHRRDFLLTQKNDIKATMEKLKEIINTLTKEMETQFIQGIQEISRNFDKCFKEMFGGGHARLQLASHEDVLTSAIEIAAQPPGKKITNLTLMSLGEKTLTAISLLFSILHNRPSPFLLLDEIEAPLDHANNLKFANYVKNFRSNIQFILITHKRLTMEAAANIYGITMEEGVSQTISIEV